MFNIKKICMFFDSIFGKLHNGIFDLFDILMI